MTHRPGVSEVAAGGECVVTHEGYNEQPGTHQDHGGVHGIPDHSVTRHGPCMQQNDGTLSTEQGFVGCLRAMWQAHAAGYHHISVHASAHLSAIACTC